MYRVRVVYLEPLLGDLEIGLQVGHLLLQALAPTTHGHRG